MHQQVLCESGMDIWADISPVIHVVRIHGKKEERNFPNQDLRILKSLTVFSSSCIDMEFILPIRICWILGIDCGESR